jgi:hypothetical protein
LRGRMERQKSHSETSADSRLSLIGVARLHDPSSHVASISRDRPFDRIG